jgi:hypothetical protein
VKKQLSIFLLFAVIAGCAALYTDTRFHDELGRQLDADNWEAAIGVVEKAREQGAYPDKDRLLYFLDVGILHHYAGHYEKSNQYLEQAELAIEELFTASISRAALSMMLNDNVLEYRGEDYEDIYVNVFKALNYIALGQHDEALVEIRRIDLKLQLLTDKYVKWENALNQFENKHLEFKAKEVDFHNDALGRYLGALLYYYDGRHDDARIDMDYYQLARTTQSQIYAQSAFDLSLSALDTSLLHVVAFTGNAPEKTAVNFRVHTGKNHILVFPEHRGQSFAERFAWEGITEGYYFKFALPELQRRSSYVQSIEVYANGQYIGNLQLLEDLSRVAEVTFERHKSLIYLKSIVRTVLKGIAGQKAKQEFAEEEQPEEKEEKANGKKEEKEKKDQKKKEESEKKETKTGRSKFAKWLFAAAVDVVTEITEQADLRTWRTMPGATHTGYFPLAEGTYDISIRFLDTHRSTIAQRHFPQIKVQKSQLNMVEAVLLR